MLISILTIEISGVLLICECFFNVCICMLQMQLMSIQTIPTGGSLSIEKLQYLF